MHDVVRTVFAGLFDLDPAVEEPKLQSNIGEDDSELKMSVGTTATVPTVLGGTPTESKTLVEAGVDQHVLPPSSAVLERIGCMSLIRFRQPMY